MREFARRTVYVLVLMAMIGAAYVSASEPVPAAHSDVFTVYKHPLCFCCKKWVQHLNHAGLQTDVAYRGDMSKVKGVWGVPQGMESCHTAVWHGEYVFEGHVPARFIRQFLAAPPEGSFGLSVPGMPEGSPGMYDGGEFEPYVVYLLLRGGDYRFYAKVDKPEVSSQAQSPAQ